MNDMIEITMQTPIEIALGIDENGMTTAKKLFDFLGMAKITILVGLETILLTMNLQKKILIIFHSSLTRKT